MTKKNIFLTLIICLAFFLRFFYLGKIPNGFYSDEAAYGYNAYSILKTGKDEYGQFLPVAFKSFGDFKAPLYIYFMTPVVGIFGLNEIAVRMVSAILGLLLVILIYFIAKEIFHRPKISLLSTFVASISPFALQFNRMAHENNLVVILIAAGIYTALHSLKKINYIVLSTIFFAASVYTYHDARIFTPLFIILFLILNYRNYRQNIYKVLFCFLLFLSLAVPLLSQIQSPAFWSRPGSTIIFGDVGTILSLNQFRGEDNLLNFPFPLLWHNKLLSYTTLFSNNFLQHFSADFLFFSGDPVKIYQTPQNGILYLFDLPFIILGIYFIFKRNISSKWILLIWLLLSPVAASLTKFTPSSSRTLMFLPIFSILIAAGIAYFIEAINKLRFQIISGSLITIVYIFSVGYYLHYYYVHMPLTYAKEWHYGMNEVLTQVEKLENRYDTIWFSKNAWGYIYPLFYLKYSPEEYQVVDHLGGPNAYGFGWVSGFAKYRFDDFPKNMKSENTLFIGTPADFPTLKRKIFEVDYPNHEPAFYFADSKSF